jgi:His-Xaa-Ser system protein HxsD
MTADVSFDPAVYSLDAVKTACHRFLDRFTSDIELRDGKILCRLSFDAKVSSATADGQIENFKREVLDQDLRLKLKAETEPIRNLILAHVFSRTGLIADE